MHHFAMCKQPSRLTPLENALTEHIDTSTAGVRQPRQLYAAVILTTVIGTIVTIGAFLLVCSWEYRVAEIDVQSKAKATLRSSMPISACCNTIAAFSR
jgi:hypothetical protein